MDSKQPKGIFNQLKDPANKQAVVTLFSGSGSQNKPADTAQKPLSPFFKGSFNSSADKFKAIATQNEDKSDSRSNTTEKKLSPPKEPNRGDPRGNMAKKGGKPPSEDNPSRSSGVFGSQQSQPQYPSEGSKLGARDMMSMMGSKNKADNKESQDPVIPCLAKNKEQDNTEKKNEDIAAQFQAAWKNSNMAAKAAASNPTITNPLKTETQNKTNVFQPQPQGQSQPSSQQTPLQNFFQKPQNSTTTPPAPAQPSNLFQTSQPSHPLPTFPQPSSAPNQIFPPNQPPLPPHQPTVINAQKYHHKQKMLHIPSNKEEESMFHQLEADFDVDSLTIDHFLSTSFDLLSEMFQEISFLAKRPQQLLQRFDQNTRIRLNLRELEYNYRCSPHEILEKCSEIEQTQKELEHLIRNLDSNTSIPIEEHALSYQLRELTMIEDDLVDQQLQHPSLQGNELIQTFHTLTTIEQQLHQLQADLDKELEPKIQ